MNPASFDNLVRSTLEQYGPLGARAQLLGASARHTGHGDWTNVIVEVTSSDKGPSVYAEDWRYGGVNTHEKIARPIGIALIEANRMIGAEKAAEALPPGFPLDQASCDLYWAVPHLFGDEPHYYFSFEAVTLPIGAYRGQPFRR